MRINKYLAQCNIGSRRKVEEYILAGRVTINDKVVTLLATQVLPTDIVKFDGNIVKPSNVKLYYLLNKPSGYITSVSDDRGRHTVLDLIESTPEHIFPVGRLDYDTECMLIITNDGDFANQLIHPSNQIDKVYLAKIDCILGKNELQALRNGVLIDGFKTAPAKVKIKQYSKSSNMSLIEITIHEGKNHQVKKMFEAVNHKVIKLKRESVGFFDLKGLKAGEYRRLTIKEVKKVYALQNE